ncbi:hypothetical protein J2Z83_000792 [Virgibacillus natechei]|uniref:YqzL family protein n=1 Tax=Virgibacillus natechei TaxID=1216297 RepID=A0ABS4ICQ3_9BACI|nr:YqzL family protein [Virgibacillus natechei]MBP1968698.1 hypothetical protein [Virgibacillus natechei]UZD11500.1 YqzL family protein [Virgibacillus natechei]
MVDITWKIFSETGNIETYLLMKELENEHRPNEVTQTENEVNESLDTRV